MNPSASGNMAFETEPDPEFLAHLEWQVRTAARREGRFGGKAVSGSGWRRMRGAAAIALTLCLGAGGVLAAQELQRAREADLRTAQWQVRCTLVNAHVRAATAERDEVRRGFEAGLRDAGELAAVERQFQRVEHERARVENELEEVAYTGREPSNRLSAPTIAARDFVRERLEIEATEAEAELHSAEQHLQFAVQRHEAGTTSFAEVAEAEQRRKQALGRQSLVARRLALRAAFLDGQTTAQAVELDELLAFAEEAARERREALAAAHEALARAEELAAAGIITQLDLRSAQRIRFECEAALRLAELELDVLGIPRGPR